MTANKVSASRSRFVDVLIILAIALVGVVTWKMQPKSDVALPLSDCDLNHQSCGADLPGGGHIELSVDPRPIPSLRPIKLALAATGIEPDKVELDFTGVDMNMGYNRPELKRAPSGEYQGRTTLPACITGSMEWQATLLLDTGRQVISVPLRFKAGGD